MVSYFVLFEFTVTPTSAMVYSGTSDTVTGDYYDPAPVAVRSLGAGFEALACRGERVASLRLPTTRRISARRKYTPFHELRPP